MRPATLALVALVCLAGCAGTFGDPSTSTPTPTESSDPTPTATPTPTSTPVVPLTAPPGVASDGVDAERLVMAHNATLNGTAYDLRVAQESTRTRRIRFVTEGPPGPSIIQAATPVEAREEYFTPDGRFYQRIARGGNVSYEQGQALRPPSFTGGDVLLKEFARARYEPARATYFGETPVVVLRADRSDLRSGAFQGASIDRFESSVLVSRTGTVHAFTLAATGTLDERQFGYRVNLSVRSVGTATVSEPAWVAERRNATVTA